MLLFNCIVVLSILVSFSKTFYGLVSALSVIIIFSFLKKISFALLFKNFRFHIISNIILLLIGYFSIKNELWYIPALKFSTFLICAQFLNSALSQDELLNIIFYYIRFLPAGDNRKKNISSVIFISYNVVMEIINDGGLLKFKFDKKKNGIIEKSVLFIYSLEKKIDEKILKLETANFEAKTTTGITFTSIIPIIFITLIWWFCEYSLRGKL